MVDTDARASADNQGRARRWVRCFRWKSRMVSERPSPQGLANFSTTGQTMFAETAFQPTVFSPERKSRISHKTYGNKGVLIFFADDAAVAYKSKDLLATY